MFNSHKKSKQAVLHGAIDKYYEAIYRHVRRLVADHDEARDIVQETFLKACVSIDTLREADAIKTWLYRIATNLAMNALKARRDISSLDDEGGERLMTDVAEVDEDDDPNLRLRHLDDALMSLTPAQRTVFDLRHYDELPFKEIADITGGSVDTVRVVYHHAKEKLRRFLTDAARKNDE